MVTRAGAPLRRGGTAIVGTGLAGRAATPARGGGGGAVELLAAASLHALAEAALPLSAVDGVFAAIPGEWRPALAVAEYLGLMPRHAGDACGAALLRAALALEARLCDVALICDLAGAALPGGPVVQPHEAPYGPREPLTGYALVASRHMHEFGTTREDLAEVALAARGWAGRNPLAALRGPLTQREVLDSPLVSDPLSVLDCGLAAGGGGAAVCVMMRAAEARDRPKPSAFLLGGAGAGWHRTIARMPDLTVTAASESGPRAYAAAGLTPKAVDLVLVEDGCTIAPILFLEDLGFCPKGEGGRFVTDGRIGPGGDLAVNTHGGALSCGPAGEAGLLPVVEAVAQLRREAGARQVAACDVALVHGSEGGGAFAAQATVLLGTAAAL